MGGQQDNKPAKQRFNKSKGSFNKSDEPEYRFINVALGTQDAEKLEALISSGELGIEYILELAAQGYKCSLGSDKEHQRYVATITDKSPDSPFRNAGITGSGATPIDAWHSVAFKHYVLGSEDWTNFASPSSSKYA